MLPLTVPETVLAAACPAELLAVLGRYVRVPLLFRPESGRVTCDRYKINRVEIDPVAKIKKLYVFRSQFNLQLFASLTFVEDNGRGSISFGTCQIIAP
jgi:hypothetical protein